MAEDIFNPITAYEQARENRREMAQLAIREQFRHLDRFLGGFYEVNDAALALLIGEVRVAAEVLIRELEALRDGRSYEDKP